MTELQQHFSGKQVLITGGLGMLGSSIACRLVDLGASVAIVDACLKPYGGNEFNIEAIRDKVAVTVGDIRDPAAMESLVPDMDFVYNLAAQVSHNDSMTDPGLDAAINYLGHLTVLESLRKLNPTAVVLHTGSRLQYGRIERIPVDEKHPLRPRTPYALNKTAAEGLYRFFYEMHGIRCVLFRVANPYGPRSQMRHHKYSMVNWFIRQSMDGNPITIFGDGRQIRDYIYIDDLVDACLWAVVTPGCHGEVFNVGSGTGLSFADMCSQIVRIVPGASLEFVPWPPDYVNVETGDYVADISKIKAATSWSPGVDLKTGIERTCRYYQTHRAHYW